MTPVKNIEFKVQDKFIGAEHPVFIVAELSANHNHDYVTARETIKEIKKCGADAVKLQTYTADTVTIDCNNSYFKIKQGTIWDGKTLYQLYKEAYTPWEWLPKLKKFAEGLGLIFFTSVNDKTAVDFMEKLKTPVYKVPSFEITDIPLIEYIASKGKPIIFSSGIATLNEIEEALQACRKKGNNRIALLKCTSAYPAQAEEANLNTIPDLKNRFKIAVGLSDHTLGTSVPIAAVALGAKIIEKHFILEKKIGGPDALFSLRPKKFKEMVESIREVEKALGSVSYELTEGVKRNREFSRSLFVVKDIRAGELLTSENIRSIRPGFGLAPKYYDDIIGKKAKIDLLRGTPLINESIA